MKMKYNVILADPPWDQKAGRKLDSYKVESGRQIWNSKNTESEKLPYPTMTVDEIASLPVKNICEKDAHLFLWVTNKYLLKASKVIKAWGFRYVATITWKKKRRGGGLGGLVRITSEHLLFCRRGHLKAIGSIPESVIEAKRPYKNGYPRHSAKPDIFWELIEKASPGRKIELFARNRRTGWDAWGNEVDSDIDLLGE